MLFRKQYFGQISKFWSKIVILAKNRNFGQKLEFWSKRGILAKNLNFGPNRNFYESGAENRKLDHKSKSRRI